MTNEWKSPYNPFNSMKNLVHVNYWKQIIEDGIIPPPIQVSVDPSNICNAGCDFCNAHKVMKDNKGAFLSKDFMIELGNFLNRWGVKTVCVGGGGESLLNKNVDYLFDSLHDNDIDFNCITNGSMIHKHLDSLMKAKFIGVSIDAGSEEVYNRLKKPKNYTFNDVLNNCVFILQRNPDFDLTYKYLIWPDNIKDIYTACKLAKNIGFKRFHVRPADYPYFVKGKKLYSSENLRYVDYQLNKIKKLEDENFEVYGITHKFNPDFTAKKNFKKCYAGFITVVVYPSKTKEATVHLCCDRRGDKSLELCEINYPDEILKYWGKLEHQMIMHDICLSECPRCTMIGPNTIFQEIILKDKMLVNFI